MDHPRVSVIIPTQRRAQPLGLAVRSVMRQVGLARGEAEVVIVDNDAVDSARALAAELARSAPFPVTYVHEPSAGVANARNAGLKAARGALIAFLDDDEEAPDGWLAELLGVQADQDADAVFGPVRARVTVEGRHRAYFEAFFSRSGPQETGPIVRAYGCGNSLVRRAALPHPDAPFSPLRNHIGGEDDMLFGQMKKDGARFAWAARAFVWEDPMPSRQVLSYTLRRAFAYGQGPSAQCAAASPPDVLGLVRWGLIGAMQATAFGLVAAFKALTGAPDLAFWLDRAARGLGKIFWGRWFKIEFYGRPAIPSPPPAAGDARPA